MIGRSALTRGAQLALRRDGAKLAQKRAYAATAGASTETASFESADINGINVASRDPRSPTTRLTVVAKAGTRYQPAPGLSVGLEEFAFKASRHRHMALPAQRARGKSREFRSDHELTCHWARRTPTSDPH